ncbi:MAG: hypothetical protein H6725_05575 [Sandaracinaceae bacterium]|nr:hypothetical protein [Sandaracinaceae bacterium]
MWRESRWLQRHRGDQLRRCGRVANIGSPSWLAIDETNGRLYVITYNNTELVRANLDGTDGWHVAVTVP